MKYLAAYALLSLSGKKDINAADLKKVLGDAQIKADDAEINRLLESVKGKPIHQLIAEGHKQIGASGSVAAGGSAPAAKETKKEDKKEEKKDDKKPAEKKKEAPPPPPVEEDDNLGDLFG